MRAFTVSCLWLGMDGTIVRADTGRAALRSVLDSHWIARETTWGLTHVPARSADHVDMWSASFQANGIESILVFEAEPADLR